MLLLKIKLYNPYKKQTVGKKYSTKVSLYSLLLLHSMIVMMAKKGNNGGRDDSIIIAVNDGE
jgi:hypothetical protein